MKKIISKIFLNIENQEKRWLFGIIICALAVSLSYSFHFHLKPSVDAKAYDSIAWDIAEGKGYDTNSSIGRPGPGYEYFLATLYKIFGHHYPLVWIIQSLLLAATAFLVYLSAKRIWASGSPIIGIFAAFLIGFSPDLITSASLLMTEILTVFLITLTLYIFLISADSRKIWHAALLAVAFVATALTRSNIIFIAVPIIIFFLSTKKWKQMIVFCLLTLVLFTPWSIRNYKIYGEVRPFSGALGLLYVGNHAGASGELDLHYELPEGYGDFSKMTQFENDTALKKAGLDYIRLHPIEFLKRAWWRFSIYWSAARPFAFWPHLQGIAKIITIIASTLYALIIFIMGLSGVFLSNGKHAPFKEKKKNLAVSFMVLMLPLAITPLIIETRYRFPIYPFLAIFAGYALYCLVKNRSYLYKKMATLAIVISIVLANTGYDIGRNLARVLGRLHGINN